MNSKQTGPTPGPWKLSTIRDGYQGISTANGEWSGLAKVAVALGDNEALVRSPHGEANARLIAAAPELLEALKDALVQLERFANMRGMARCADLRCKIQVAIDKAEGR